MYLHLLTKMSQSGHVVYHVQPIAMAYTPQNLVNTVLLGLLKDRIFVHYIQSLPHIHPLDLHIGDIIARCHYLRRLINMTTKEPTSKNSTKQSYKRLNVGLELGIRLGKM